MSMLTKNTQQFSTFAYKMVWCNNNLFDITEIHNT